MKEFDLEKDKKCWLSNHNCPCQNAGCYGLPDNGCPVYRWFKEVKEWNENNRPEIA